MREPSGTSVIWSVSGTAEGADRVKGKVAESLAVKGRTVAEAMQLLPDAISTRSSTTRPITAGTSWRTCS